MRSFWIASSSSTSRMVGDSGIVAVARYGAEHPPRRTIAPVVAGLRLTRARRPAQRAARRPRAGDGERVPARLARASRSTAGSSAARRCSCSGRCSCSRSRSAGRGRFPASALPPSFDGPSATALAAELALDYPDREPGSAGALGAADWVKEKLGPLRAPAGRGRLGRDDPRARPRPAAQPRHRRAGRDRRRDPDPRPPRRHRRRARARTTTPPARLP